MNKWLKENAMTFAWIITTIISISGLLTSMAAYQISDRQLKISGAVNVSPKIVVSENYNDGLLANGNDTESLVIDNYGAEIFDVESKVYSFISVQHYDRSMKNDLIPNDYYSTSIRTNMPKLRLAMFCSFENNKNLHRLNMQLDGNSNFSISNASLVSVSYRSSLNEHREEWYFNGKRVPDDDIKKYHENIADKRWIEMKSIDLNSLQVKMALTSH